MSNQPRFLPPSGMSEKHLAGTDGHSCVIYLEDPKDKKKGTIIPDRFRKLAVAEGCGIVGISEDEDGGEGQPTKSELIIKAIAEVMKRQDAEELEGDGRPKVKAVGKQAGFNVTKTQFEAEWPLYVESLGDEDESQDD